MNHELPDVQAGFRKGMNEYYSVIRKREFLPYATTWMNLEDIMLSKIRQIQKDKYCMVSLIHGILKKKKKIKETK